MTHDGSAPGLRLSQRMPSLALQFGHLFAKGDTREAAIRAMVVALKEVKIRGEIRTTVDYCVEMIQSPDFVGNSIHTGWLDARISSHVRAPLQPAPAACPRSLNGVPALCNQGAGVGGLPHLPGRHRSSACITILAGHSGGAHASQRVSVVTTWDAGSRSLHPRTGIRNSGSAGMPHAPSAAAEVTEGRVRLPRAPGARGEAGLVPGGHWRRAAAHAGLCERAQRRVPGLPGEGAAAARAAHPHRLRGGLCAGRRAAFLTYCPFFLLLLLKPFSRQAAAGVQCKE